MSPARPDLADALPLREERSDSMAATMAIGAWLADLVEPGDVVSLFGPLGAGKTTFVRGMLRGLGYEGRVRSPSFTLVQEYPTEPPLRHADLYRLEQEDELLALGLDEEAERLVLIVEWADRIENAVEDPTWRVQLATLPGESEESRLVSVFGPQDREAKQDETGEELR